MIAGCRQPTTIHPFCSVSVGTTFNSLPCWSLHLLTVAINQFLYHVCRNNGDEEEEEFYQFTETKGLQRVMEIHGRYCTDDSTLAEELERQGTHLQLLRIIDYDCSSAVAIVTATVMVVGSWFRRKPIKIV